MRRWTAVVVAAWGRAMIAATSSSTGPITSARPHSATVTTASGASRSRTASHRSSGSVGLGSRTTAGTPTAAPTSRARSSDATADSAAARSHRGVSVIVSPSGRRRDVRTARAGPGGGACPSRCTGVRRPPRRARNAAGPQTLPDQVIEFVRVGCVAISHDQQHDLLAPSRHGTPIAAASRTPGWLMATSSISPGDMFSPPRMITSSLRPWMNR